MCACNDPIFYAISQEVVPVDPRIEGSPTNFAVYKDSMYVASGSSIHIYKDKNWHKGDKPGGNILQIAATGNYLYALCSQDQGSGTVSSVKRYNGTGWDELGGDTDSYNMVQYIFAANDTVFIGAESSGVYNIFYVDDNVGAKEAVKNLSISNSNLNAAGELSGAVYQNTGPGTYYLCTVNSGIYMTQDPAQGAALVPDTTGIRFLGMICLDNPLKTILLISRQGDLYALETGAAVSKTGASLNGRLASGALAVWESVENPSRKLLLAGRQDRLEYSFNSGYTYGYLELELDYSTGNGISNNAEFREPGRITPTSVEDNERFISTIGKHPVKYIFQTPSGIDNEMILFASTQKSGVWSYRERGGMLQWNAEE